MKFFVILLLSLSVLRDVASKPEPGKKKAFGAGLLGGALVGGLVGRAFAQNSHSSSNQQPQQSQSHHVSTDTHITIERGPVQTDGCYKQITKEPDLNNSRKYVETIHMICPAGVQPTVTVPARVPVPVNFVPVAPVARIAPAVPAASFVPAVVAQNTTHFVAPAYPVAPVQQVVPVPSQPQDPQVFIISKKVYKTKKSSASAAIGSLMMVLVSLLLSFRAI